MMNRRALLRGLMTSAPAAGAFVAGAAVSSKGYVRDASGSSINACRQQIDALRERIDVSDARTKKLLRMVLVLTAVSLGLDISALI